MAMITCLAGDGRQKIKSTTSMSVKQAKYYRRLEEFMVSGLSFLVLSFGMTEDWLTSRIGKPETRNYKLETCFS
jgi:hypothetical protein